MIVYISLSDYKDLPKSFSSPALFMLLHMHKFGELKKFSNISLESSYFVPPASGTVVFFSSLKSPKPKPVGVFALSGCLRRECL